MPDAVLFAPASLRPPIRASVQKLAIESNIRTCEFFIQIFGEAQPEPVFVDFVTYALQCVTDPTFVTSNACVFFRNYPAAVPELHELREKLAAKEECELRDFGSVDELSQQLRELLEAWYAPLKPRASS